MKTPLEHAREMQLVRAQRTERELLAQCCEAVIDAHPRVGRPEAWTTASPSWEVLTQQIEPTQADLDELEPQIGDLFDLDGDLVTMLAWFDPEHVNVEAYGDELLTVPLADLRPRSHGRYAVMSLDLDDDGEEHFDYFPTLDAAAAHAARDRDAVIEY